MKRKGQATLEFAVLIAVVAAALLTMQNYAKRAIQGRLRSTITKINEGPEYDYDQLKFYPHLLIGKTGISKEDTDFGIGSMKRINYGYSPKETEGTIQTTTRLEESDNVQDGTVITKNFTKKHTDKTERLKRYDR